jgi:hypothetical protein
MSGALKARAEGHRWPSRQRCETRNAAEPGRAADRDASRRSPFAGKTGQDQDGAP